MNHQKYNNYAFDLSRTGTQVKVVKKAEVLHDKYAHWRLEPEPLA
jgi:hypothetical protein